MTTNTILKCQVAVTSVGERLTPASAVTLKNGKEWKPGIIAERDGKLFFLGENLTVPLKVGLELRNNSNGILKKPHSHFITKIFFEKRSEILNEKMNEVSTCKI